MPLRHCNFGSAASAAELYLLASKILGPGSLSKRDSFLLRIDPKVLASLRGWADDEMRSVNAQIEFLLRQCLKQSGRLRASAQALGEPSDSNASQINQDARQGQEDSGRASDSPNQDEQQK